MDGAGRRAILALDGGGVRGAITVAFLERLEILVARQGRGRLCDAFDLVGGASTGAIIAGALAMGHSATEIREFYMRLAPRVFRRSRWRIAGLQSRFDERPLLREIENVVGERTLDTPDLRWSPKPGHTAKLGSSKIEDERDDWKEAALQRGVQGEGGA